MKWKATALAAVFCSSLLAMAGQVRPSKPMGALPRFRIEPTSLNLFRPADPNTYFDKVGRKFAILGAENGSFEAWAFPLKIIRGFDFSFLVGTSTVPIEGRDIVRFISVDPAVTTLTFAYQSFTVRAHYITAINDPAAVILLEVDATEPLTIICSFLPVLQPMWPAGLGGQYASWDEGLKAYLVSEPTRKNHGYVGSPAAQGISYTPAHMLSETPSQFKIEIADPKAFAGVSLPIILAGGKGNREDIQAVYKKLATDPEAVYRETVEHFRNMLDGMLQVRTPDEQLNSALSWAEISLGSLLVDNPDLGRGLVAGWGPSGTGGRPGFGWFFGTDAYLNSLSFDSFNAYRTVREALAFTGKWQRRDGKMAHELSQAAGYLKWWEDYPYGYLHGDTTPYYIVAVDDYVRMSGDLEFLKTTWPSLLRAYAWCSATDADGDGLMDNARAGLGALEFGTLTGIQTDIYLAAVWEKACRSMADLAEKLGDKGVAAKAGEAAAEASRALNEKFWDHVNGQYAYAFNKDGRLVQELTPWSAVALAWDSGKPERGTATLAKLNSADMSTDWGTRMLSSRSPYYEPLNYNYGAVWPFLSGWVSTALLRYGFVAQGFGTLVGTARHLFDNSLGSATELFSGQANVWPQEAVPHQGFSASGLVLPFVRGLLGLDGDALKKEISFEPCFPVNWPGAAVSNWKIGGGVFSLDYDRQDLKVRLKIRSLGDPGFKLLFAPAFGLGTRILRASLNGTALEFALEAAPYAQSVRPRMRAVLTGDDTIELMLDPAPEIIPPNAESRTGDLNHGLKILRTSLAGHDLKFMVEGLAGESYVLDLRNGSRVESATGAVFDGKRLIVHFAAGQPGEFIKQEIALRLKT